MTVLLKVFLTVCERDCSKTGDQFLPVSCILPISRTFSVEIETARIDPAVSIGGDGLTDAMVKKRRVFLAIYSKNIRPQESFRNQAPPGG
jgi:hypothetical protein